MSQSENLFTIKEAASRLRQAEEELLRKIEEGFVSAEKIDGKYYVSASEMIRIGLDRLGECLTQKETPGH